MRMTFVLERLTSSAWMPNFGAVWSYGPRSETRKRFHEGSDEEQKEGDSEGN
jgi:hypothetical protein